MKISLVVPAHNETGNLERLVDCVFSTLADEEFGYAIEIVLVDDNSTDETPEICDQLAARDKRIRVVHRTSNPGFGNAIKAGLETAEGDVLIPFMGDLSDDPRDIPKLIQGIEQGNDVVHGSRFVSGGNLDGYPKIKLLYNRAYNNLIRLLFGTDVRDTTNAFTAYRREVIDEIGIETIASESFDITAELPLRAHILGFTSTEVPVSWRSREEGVSKLNATKKGPLYLKRVLRQFIIGNVVGLKDLFGAITKGHPLRILGASILGLLILVGVFSIAGFNEIYALILQTKVVWLGVGATAYLMSFLFRTWRYRVLLRTADHLATRSGVFRSIMAGWFVNFILPARAGDAARGIALKTTEGIPFSVGVGLVIIERILDMITLGIAMIIVGWIFLASRQAQLLAYGALAIALTLMIGLIIVYAFDTRVADLLNAYVPKIEQSIAELNQALKRIVRNPFAMVLSLGLSAFVWAFELTTIYFSARSIGITLRVVETITAAVAGFVAQAVPVTPAGIGTYEATITATLAVFGVSTRAGTSISLIDHFTRAAVTYIIGAISIIHIGFQSRAYFRQRSIEGDNISAKGED